MTEPKLLTPGQIAIRIFVIDIVIEFLIMLFLGTIQLPWGPFETALLDVVLLATLSVPAIYVWVIIPFVRARDAALTEANQMAMTDALTHLANRRYFDRVLFPEHARLARTGGELSIIMLDIDLFKAYNDTYGHVKGDDCLRQVGFIIKSCVARPADLAARYGGEEFVCILPETGMEGAGAIAEKIRAGIEALAIPHASSDTLGLVTASLGVATMRCSYQNTGQGLVDEADRVLYLAKSKGRNRVEAVTVKPGVESAHHFIRLIWHDAYSSGNALIDAQHRELFHAADLLLDAILADHPHDELFALINQLLEGVTRHFHDEIQILESLHYPNMQPHAEEHAALLGKARQLKQELDEGKLSAGEVFQFLAYDVITRHMLKSDRDFFPLTRAASADLQG